MFCQKCGNKIEDTAKFCNKCGTKAGGSAKEEVKVEDNSVVLQVKPKFKMMYESIGFIIGIVIFLLIMLIPMLAMASEEGEDAAIFMRVMLIILIPVAIIWAIAIIIRRFQYKKYTYDFYKTKITYRDSFLNISEKEVKYKNVKEIIYTQGIIQRLFNIGNVTLFTNADSGVANGIRIRSIENVKEVYDKIKGIVNN